MTRSELTNLFIRKTELFNSEQLLFSLKESYSVAIESGFSENLERNIFELEQKITREKAAIEQDRETALQTLKLIEDDAGRVGAMLHYRNKRAVRPCRNCRHKRCSLPTAAVPPRRRCLQHFQHSHWKKSSP